MAPKVVVDGVVRAAGGVVTRRGATGAEVLVVHRPRRQDWSFPKGHLHPGETDLEAARREVAEETGLDVVEVRDLGEVAYLAEGRPKAVRFWEMRTVDGGAERHDERFDSDDEVDEVRWVSAAEARSLLTHDTDRDLLAALTGPVG
jgi:8-oxo-dGTP diphosphatase